MSGLPSWLQPGAQELEALRDALGTAHRRATEQEEVISRLREELRTAEQDRDRALQPWAVRLSLPDPANIYEHHDCRVIDIGHSDRVLLVECPDLDARLSAIEEKRK